MIYGSKYDRSIDIVEIAKRVRADVKTAVDEGRLPAPFAVGVRVQKYSGGRSLHVTIKDMPGDIFSSDFIAWYVANPHASFHDAPARYVPEARAVLDCIKEIVGAYNHDGSDISTDYFNVNFYEHISFDEALERSSRERILARMAEAALAGPEPTAEPEKVAVGAERPGMNFTVGDIEITTTLRDIYPSNVIPFPVGGRRGMARR